MPGVYSKLLSTHPVLTKAVTAGALSGLGDVIAHGLFGRGGLEPISFSHQVLIGLILKGPYFHYVFKIIERLFENSDKRNISTVLKKMAVAQGIFSPVFLFMYLTVLACLRGEKLSDAVARIRRSFLSILKVNYCFWPLVDLTNFSFIPPAYRVLYSNIAGMLWVIYLIHRTSGTREKSKKQ